MDSVRTHNGNAKRGLSASSAMEFRVRVALTSTVLRAVAWAVWPTGLLNGRRRSSPIRKGKFVAAFLQQKNPQLRFSVGLFCAISRPGKAWRNQRGSILESSADRARRREMCQWKRRPWQRHFGNAPRRYGGLSLRLRSRTSVIVCIVLSALFMAPVHDREVNSFSSACL